MAVLPVRAVLSETVVAGRGHARPDLGILRDPQLGDVAARRRLRPLLDLLQTTARLRVQVRNVVDRELQTVAAEIVGASLQQGSPHRNAERGPNQRQIAMKQLVLEVARPGGDQDLAPGEDGRHQIGEGLACAGARLADECAALLHERCDPLGHRLLLRTMGETGQTLGEPTIRTEDVAEIGHGGGVVP